MKIEVVTESTHLWKLVRRDNFTDILGNIVAADEETGECSISRVPPGQTATQIERLSFGPNGFRIVRR